MKHWVENWCYGYLQVSFFYSTGNSFQREENQEESFESFFSHLQTVINFFFLECWGSIFLEMYRAFVTAVFSIIIITSLYQGFVNIKDFACIF